MPALQVRDFPDYLYEQLKASAEREHRSLAQQATALIERGLAAAEWGADAGAERRRGGPVVRHLDMPGEREQRIAKRKELFAAIDETNKRNNHALNRLSTDQIVAMIREDRDSGHSDACMLAEEER